MPENNDIRAAADAEMQELKSILKATEMAEMKRACHDLFTLYTEYRKAGFNEKQAMQLVMTILQGAFTQPKK